PMALREHVAHTLAGINQPASRAELLKVVAAAPARLQGVIAVGLAGSLEGGEKLLEAVATGKASARLLQERLVLARLQGAKVPHAPERVAKLTQNLPPADERFQALMRQRRTGFAKAKADPAVGLQVYEKNCG